MEREEKPLTVESRQVTIVNPDVPEDEDLRFLALNHEMVPLHEVVPEKEVPQVLKEYGITLDQLPKIRSDDPALVSAASLAGIAPGTAEFEGQVLGKVVRITRRSLTAGTHTAYRLVVQSL